MAFELFPEFGGNFISMGLLSFRLFGVEAQYVSAAKLAVCDLNLFDMEVVCYLPEATTAVQHFLPDFLDLSLTLGCVFGAAKPHEY